MVEKRKAEYLFLAKIREKAIERKRITYEEIEKIIEISFNHGYDSAKKLYLNLEGEDYD